MVETAVTLPLLAVLVLGAIEAANAIFIKQSLTIAAYEAGKLAGRPGSTSTQAINRGQQILDARGITGYSVTVSPTITTATARGTQIVVTVTCPGDSASLGPLQVYTGKTLTKQVRMVRL